MSFNLAAFVEKSGHWAIVGAYSTATAANGKYTPYWLSAVNDTGLVFYRNGRAVATGTKVTDFSGFEALAFVAYPFLCGQVTGVNVVSGGKNMANPSVSAPNITFGPPVLDTGVVDYTLANRGSGYPQPPAVTITDSTGSGALAYVVVTNNGARKYVVTNGGSNYSNSPAIACGNATARAVVVGGVITDIIPITFGSGMNNGPSVGVGNPPNIAGPIGNKAPQPPVAVVYGPDAGNWGAVAGSIRTILPYAGGLHGCGTGYDPTRIPPVTIGAPGAGGVQATATAVVSGYIKSVPVLSSPANFDAPPTITIADPGGGTGAILTPIMSGVSPSDVITCDIPAGMLTAYSLSWNAGAQWWNTVQQGSAPSSAQPGASIQNFAGQLEGAIGAFYGTRDTPTMKAAANAGPQPMTRYNPWFHGMNKLRGGYAVATGGRGVITIDPASNPANASFGIPKTWTYPTATAVESLFYGPGGGATNAIDTMSWPGLVGPWTLKYDDPNVNTAMAQGSWLASYFDGANLVATPVMLSGPSQPIVVPPQNITMSGGTSGAITGISLANLNLGQANWQGADVYIGGGNNPGTLSQASANVVVSGGLPAAAIMITGGNYASKPTVLLYGTAVSGTEVTKVFDFEFVPTTTPGTGPSEWSPTIAHMVTSPAGTDGLGHWTISNAWAVPPDASTRQPNTAFSRSNPYATDRNVLAHITAPNGAACGGLRFMQATGNVTGNNNYVLDTDLMDASHPNWSQQRVVSLPIQAVRAYNTNPAKGPAPTGDGTYAWCSPVVYGPQAEYVFGPDSTGMKYLQLQPGDGGAFMQPTGTAVAIELVFASPHGLSPGYNPRIAANSGADNLPIPTTLVNPSTGKPITFSPGVLSAGNYDIWVTGPNTVVFWAFCSSLGTGAVPQTVAGTAPIPVNWTLSYGAPEGTASIPFEPTAAECAEAGTPLFRTLPHAGTDALYQKIAQIDWQYFGAPTAGAAIPVLVQCGNELWNFAVGKNYITALVRLQAAQPAGTNILGAVVGNSTAYDGGALRSGYAYDVYTAAWQAAGGDPARVKTVYGSQFVSPHVTALAVAAAQASNRRVDYVCIAPYFGLDADPSIIQACAPPGSIGGALSLPPDATNGLARQAVLYSSTYWACYAGHANCIASFTQPAGSNAPPPQLICYESSFERPIPDGTPLQAILEHDAVAHPSGYDLEWAYSISKQRGAPDVPNSGTAIDFRFNLYNAPSYPLLWRLATGPEQLPGDGSTNRYALADGHDHNQTNTSPILKAWRDWFIATAGITGSVASDSFHFTDTATLTTYQPAPESFGRFRRGDKVPLEFEIPSAPDFAPIVVIADSGGTQVDAFSIPAVSRDLKDYDYLYLIGPTFALGTFQVYLHYTVSGVANLARAAFDVIAGGDAGGSVISLYGVDRPEARSIVAQLSSGRLVVGGNPRLKD